MLSLSASLVAVVKFMLYDLAGYLQVTSSFSGSMPTIKFPSFFTEVSEGISHFINLGLLYVKTKAHSAPAHLACRPIG